MEERGIVVRAASRSGVAEEAGFAYKDLSQVVDVVHRLDVSRKVAALRPIGNIKG
jgi:tRNA-splicing ligase RtcB